MSKHKGLKGFQGIFFDEEVEKQLIALQERGLENNINNMHVTFKFGNTERYPEELVGKEFEIKLTGYGCDGKNSGFSVELPEELKKIYKSINIPHITVSIGEVDGVKGKPVDTANIDFKPLSKIQTIKGKLGYFTFEKGLVMDNKIIDQYQKENAPKNVRVFLVPKYMNEDELTKANIVPTATVEAEYGEKVIKGRKATLAHHTKEYEKNPAPCNNMDVPILDDDSTIVISHLDLDTIRRYSSINGKKKGR